MSKRPLDSTFYESITEIEQTGSSCSSWEVGTEKKTAETDIENESPPKVARILPEFVTVSISTEEPELKDLNMLQDILCSASTSWIQLFNLYVPELVINIHLYEIKSKWGKIVIGLHTKVEEFMAFSKRPQTNIKVRVVRVVSYLPYQQEESKSGILQTAFQTITQNANTYEDRNFCGPKIGMEIAPFRIEDGSQHGITTQISTTVPLNNNDQELALMPEADTDSSWKPMWKPLFHATPTRSNSPNPQDHIDYTFSWTRTIENEENMDYDNPDEGHSTKETSTRSGTAPPSALMNALLGRGYQGVIQIPKASSSSTFTQTMQASQVDKKSRRFLNELFDEDTEEMIMLPEPDNIPDDNNNSNLVATKQNPFPAFLVRSQGSLDLEYDMAAEAAYEEDNAIQEMSIQRIRFRRSQSVSSIDSDNSDMVNL